jgi:mannosyl-3-phosphoglycerate phosphatase
VTPERVVVSGIDGGLLDPVTKDYDPARPAVAALARLGVPLVLCSSRPRAEVALISRLFGLGAPMIVENGAALIVPDGHLAHGVPGGAWDGEFHVLRLGPPRQTLREALLEVAAPARVEVRLAADLPPGDRSHGGVLAGLSAHASRRYEHTDPFLLEREEDAVALAREAEARSLRVARGKGLFHLCGGADKGLAVRTLLSLYEREGRRPGAVALGAWPLDLPMLRAAHRPIVLPGPGGRVEPSLAAELPRAERAPRGGAEGWNDAVFAVLTGRRLPTVCDDESQVAGTEGNPWPHGAEGRPAGHPAAGRVVKRTTLKLSGMCES